MIGVECAKVGQRILFGNQRGRQALREKHPVGQLPGNAPVAVGEGVDVNERGMQVSGDGEAIPRVLRCDKGLAYLEKHGLDRGGYVLRRISHTIGHLIPMVFELSWPFSQRPTTLIIGTVRDGLMAEEQLFKAEGEP